MRKQVIMHLTEEQHKEAQRLAALESRTIAKQLLHMLLNGLSLQPKQSDEK